MRQALPVLAALVGTMVGLACASGGNASTERLDPAANVKPADSTCAEILAAGRTNVDTFSLGLGLGTSRNASERIFQLTVLQEVLSGIPVPSEVNADFARRRGDAALRRPNDAERKRAAKSSSKPKRTPAGEFDALISFTVMRDGSLDSIEVPFPSQIPALHEIVTRALRNADSLGRIVPVPQELAAPMRFELRLFVRERQDSLAHPFASVPVRFPVLTKAVSAKPNKAPPYPREAITRGIEGGVLVSFVVDTSGSVRRRSIRVLDGRHMDLILAVGRSLERFQFNPAEYRGCPVPAYAQLPFEFVISE